MNVQVKVHTLRNIITHQKNFLDNIMNSARSESCNCDYIYN